MWDEAFWKPAPTDTPLATLGRAFFTPVLLLGVLTLGLTVAAGPVFDLCRRAAEQLLHADGYVHAVLGGS
jgi:formate hydrogenlyase subunit 3/multisubunit Na+/H+ antiporter MnhD subunit